MQTKSILPRFRTYRPDKESGGAIAFVLIITAIMLFVAAMGVNLSLNKRKTTLNARNAKEYNTCAEVALERARVIMTNTVNWNTYLVDGGPLVTTGSCSTGPDAGAADAFLTYQVSAKDNVDDPTDFGLGHRLSEDNDNIIILKAQALLFGVPVSSVSAVVQKTTAGGSAMGDYSGQDRGGASNFGTQGNENTN